MINTTTLFEATITYGFVHIVGEVGRRLVKRGFSELRKERNRVIRNHVKADHGGRLKHCLDDACASLRMRGLDHQGTVPVASERAERTEL